MNRPDVAAAWPAAETSIPVLLARRQGVVFVAVPEGVTSLILPERIRAEGSHVVALPASAEEAGAGEIHLPQEPGAWRHVPPRPGLLAPALARLLAGEHEEMTLNPGRDGLKAVLTKGADRRPYPIAARDSLALLAAVLQLAPRGIVRTGGPSRDTRLLLAVHPGLRPLEYRVRLGGVASAPPSMLEDTGLSPALLEATDEFLARPGRILLVTGDSASGRSTSLDLLAGRMLDRGWRGGRIGADLGGDRPGIAPLAPSLADWPFPASLCGTAPDFILVDGLNGEREMVLAARLAALGHRVLATVANADPAALAAQVTRRLENEAGPAVPLMVLAQALVRTVCPSCLQWDILPPAQTSRLGLHPRDLEETVRHGGLAVPRGRGCRACGGTGFAGVTGVFAGASTMADLGRWPSVREEGWRRVIEGTASYLDVLALPCPRGPLASFREVVALSGASPLRVAPSSTPTATPAPDAAKSPSFQGAGVPPPGSADVDADDLSRLAHAAREGAPPRHDHLTRLATTLAGRAAHGRLAALLAEGGTGAGPARHAVNTALIAVRLVTALGQDEDGPATALLALVHDPSLLGAADAAAIVRMLGIEDGETARRLGEVQAILGAGNGPHPERARTDLRSQAVALAALIHRAYQAGKARGLDVHDVTSTMMVEHGRSFSPLLFRALLRAIPIFPIGCLVELSSGDLARVVSQNEENHFRPRVEITAARGGTAPGEARVVDLSRAPFLHIRQRITAPRLAEGDRP